MGDLSLHLLLGNCLHLLDYWGDEGPIHGMQTPPVASDKCRHHRYLMVAWQWGGIVSNKLL